MKNASQSHSAREAREFLVSKIVEEARREGVTLSDVERKMLYFSETDWTLPEIGTASEEFDLAGDQDDYEKKIALLVRSAYARTIRDSDEEYQKWWSVIRILTKQDYYICVIIRKAGLRPRHDQLKLLGAGVGIVVLLVCVEFISLSVSKRYRIDLRDYWPSAEKLGFFVWVAVLILAVLATLLYYASRSKLLGGTLGQFVRKLSRTVNGGS